MLSLRSLVLVTGGSGMVGGALVRLLRRRGYTSILAPTRTELDLTDRDQTERYFAANRPEYVFFLAARVGGVGANIADPVGFISSNLRMVTNVFECCHRYSISRTVFLGSSCMYPRECPQPMKEQHLLSGPLEPTNEGYALAKIAGVKLAQAYAKQYGMDVLCPVPCNIYGTGDHFEFERAHVLSALVRRFVDAVDAGVTEVKLWGSGSAEREFIYVDDVNDAILFLLNNYHDAEIINVGTGTAVTIKQLATMIAAQVGYRGAMLWDTSMPDGMPKKCLDIRRLTALGYRAKVGLEDGVRMTIDAYRASQSRRGN